MADIGELVIKARVDSTQANATLLSLSKTVAGVATAASAAFLAFAAGIEKTAVNLDNMVNKASKLQIAVGDFQALGYAAKIANVDMSALEMSMKKLSLSVANAAGGGNKNSIFKQLGLDAQELMKLSPDKQFLAVANALKQVDNATSRAAMGTGLLGKQWVETSNLINGNLAQSLKEFDRFGLKLTDQQAALIDSYGDAKDKLATVYDGAWQKLTVKVIPALQKVVDKTTEWLLSGDNIDKLTDSIAEGMVGAIEAATAAFEVMSSVLGTALGLMREMVKLGKDLNASGKGKDGSWFGFKMQDQASGFGGDIVSKTLEARRLGGQRGFLDVKQTLPTVTEGGPVIQVTKALEKLEKAAEGAAVSMDGLLGLGAMSGQSYLSSILTEIPQAMDPTFTKLANEIRDAQLTGQGFGSSIESKLALMRSIAMQSGGESYDYTSGKMGYTSNSGMMAAVKALEDANKKDKEPVQLNISVDKEGIIKVVTENGDFIKWSDARTTKVAEEAARGARN